MVFLFYYVVQKKKPVKKRFEKEEKEYE